MKTKLGAQYKGTTSVTSKKRGQVVSLLLFAVITAVMSQTTNLLVMSGGSGDGTAGWNEFGTKMQTFFEKGLGGGGLAGVGWCIFAISIVAGIISFAMHKFNPQTRMPGWITCILIGCVGLVATNGIGPFEKGIDKLSDFILGTLGIAAMGISPFKFF